MLDRRHEQYICFKMFISNKRCINLVYLYDPMKKITTASIEEKKKNKINVAVVVIIITT